MSTTYSLVCDDCKLSYWASQQSCGGDPRWYDLEAVGRFLFAHAGHKIRNISDYSNEVEPQMLDYVEIEP